MCQRVWLSGSGAAASLFCVLVSLLLAHTCTRLCVGFLMWSEVVLLERNCKSDVAGAKESVDALAFALLFSVGLYYGLLCIC